MRGNSAAVVPLLLRSSIARPVCQRPLDTAALPRDIPSPFSYIPRIDHGTANVQTASVNHVDGQPSRRLVIIQADDLTPDRERNINRELNCMGAKARLPILRYFLPATFNNSKRGFPRRSRRRRLPSPWRESRHSRGGGGGTRGTIVRIHDTWRCTYARQGRRSSLRPAPSDTALPCPYADRFHSRGGRG